MGRNIEITNEDGPEIVQDSWLVSYGEVDILDIGSKEPRQCAGAFLVKHYNAA